MRSIKSLLIVFGMLSLMLLMCKQKDSISPDKTKISIRLQDENEVDVSGAKIYLFNTLSDWQASKLNKRAINAIDSFVNENGRAELIINPELEYYILVIYRDQKRNLTLLNVKYDSVITKLPKNIDVNATIRLSPVDGNLVFYTNDQQIVSPILIKLLSPIVGSPYVLSERRDFAPEFASDPGLLAIQLGNGRYTYQATDNLGCIWTGQVDLKVGTFVGINLSGCNFGNVAFYCEDPNPSRYSINLSINDETSGTVDGFLPSFDPNSSFVNYSNLLPGNYTYSAQSNDGKCVWTGRFTVPTNPTNGPVIVKLGVCK